MTPTHEQRDILAQANSPQSLMIYALAGTGKTTTLTLLANAIDSSVKGLALAFNVRIKEELEKRFPPNFTVKTLNGLGHVTWGRTLGRKLTVRDDKLNDLINTQAKTQGIRLGENFSLVKSLVESAMRSGLVPKKFPDYKGLVEDLDKVWAELIEDTFDPDLIPLARAVLVEDIKLSFQGTISYSDQLYMPTLFGGLFTKHDVVMVDEAQDLSAIQHLMVKKSAKDRLIVVGDKFQSIYLWRGASSNSMDKLRKLRLNWVELPLTTTFRCPSMIVERQHSHVPEFKAAPSAPRGNVERLEVGWTLPPGELAVLCRNNAPLFSLAMKLLRLRISVMMLGRDIGKNLIRLAEKILPTEGNLERAIALWANEEAEKNPKKIESITDRADSLTAISEGLTRKSEVIAALNEIFATENARVILSTGHRAKGLEWSQVLHLDPWRIPSKYARGNEEAMEQERNLRYVIETRTKQTLFLGNLNDFMQKDSVQRTFLQSGL